MRQRAHGARILAAILASGLLVSCASLANDSEVTLAPLGTTEPAVSGATAVAATAASSPPIATTAATVAPIATSTFQSAATAVSTATPQPVAAVAAAAVPTATPQPVAAVAAAAVPTATPQPGSDPDSDPAAISTTECPAGFVRDTYGFCVANQADASATPTAALATGLPTADQPLAAVAPTAVPATTAPTVPSASTCPAGYVLDGPGVCGRDVPAIASCPIGEPTGDTCPTREELKVPALWFCEFGSPEEGVLGPTSKCFDSYQPIRGTGPAPFPMCPSSSYEFSDDQCVQEILYPQGEPSWTCPAGATGQPTTASPWCREQAATLS